MSESTSSSRRRFLKAGVATAAGVALPAWTLTKGAPAIIAAESERPQALQGLQFGDPSDGSVDRLEPQRSPGAHAGRMVVRRAVPRARRIVGPHALETTDFTARQGLEGLEAGSEVFVRVSFQSLTTARVVSEPVTGRFVVPPDAPGDDDDDEKRGRWQRHGRNDIRFLWGGDTAGQGWGINPASAA